MKTAALRLAWLILVAAAGVPAAAAQPPKQNPEHLAIQAREILRKNCLPCHGGGQRTRGEVHVLDHRLLVGDGRRLIVRSSPGRSRLLELIEDGSMPWGTRPKVPEAERHALRAWVAAGAPAFARSHSDDYVLARILDDVSALPAEDRGHVRYLSLHHLLEEGEARRELDVYRDALNRLVRALSGPKASGPAPIEPTDTVFRIDLRAVGWDQPALTGPGARTLNRFDLLLLEYPYGRLYEKSPFRADLGRAFLSGAGQVRPVPFVRADWLVSAAPPLLDLPAIPDPVVEKARDLYRGVVLPAEAAAELDWDRPLPDLQKALRQPPSGKPLSLPLAEGKETPRDLWEKAFGQAVQALGRDAPVLPLDGLTHPDCEPARPPFELELRAIDALTRLKKDRFVPGDRMLIEVKSDRNVYIELVWATAKGERTVLPLQRKLVEGGQPRRIGPRDDEGYELSDELGTDQITVYAYPTDDLPPGVLFRGKGLGDRVVHAFYPDGRDKPPARPIDPSQVVKKTVAIEIVKR